MINLSVKYVRIIADCQQARLAGAAQDLMTEKKLPRSITVR